VNFWKNAAHEWMQRRRFFSLNYRQDKGLQALKFFLSIKAGDDEDYYAS
jgi:hypothetical protein